MEWPIVNPENYDFIRNENSESVQNAIEKQETEALNIIKDIDSKIKQNIDLTIDRRDHSYRFISWNNCLNIPLSIENVKVVWDILVEILNDPLYLQWDLYGRELKKESIFNWIAWAWKVIAGSENSFLSKNDIEELFIFSQDLQNIHIDDWNIDNDICANEEITRECKDALWNLKHSEKVSWQLDNNPGLDIDRKKELEARFIEWLQKHKKEQK